MGGWADILAEAGADRTAWALLGLVLGALLVRALAAKDQRVTGTAWPLFAFHLVLVPMAAAVDGSPAYATLHALAVLFVALAAVEMGAAVLFTAVLPRVGLLAPRILRDVLVAAGWLVVAFLIASHSGLDVRGVVATSAVVTAVIGLSLQDTLGNVLGGLGIQLDRSIGVGDWIKLGDVSGRVSEIRWRYTAVETNNGETAILPNSMIMRGQVLVLGRRAGAPLQWRRWIHFNVDYRWQPSDVIEAVTAALGGAPIANVAATPPPDCVLADFSDSWCRYAVRYWLTDIARDAPTDSEVRTRVYFALQRAGFPLSIPAHAVFVTEESAQWKQDKGRRDLLRRMAALDRVELFHELAPEEKRHLAEHLVYAPFTRGEVMTRQGAEAHWLYTVLEGRVSVQVSEEGATREVAVLGPGEFFGEMSLMTGARRAATAVALCDVECYRLDRAAFHDIVRRRPEIAEHVAETLAHRREQLDRLRDDLDHEAKARRLAAAKHDLLATIREFFGIAHGAGTTPPPPA